MDPLYVLQPNYIGSVFENAGLDGLVANYGIDTNYGLGVNEINNTANVQTTRNSSSEIERDRLRTAKAREFGLTKETVGF